MTKGFVPGNWRDYYYYYYFYYLLSYGNKFEKKLRDYFFSVLYSRNSLNIQWRCQATCWIHKPGMQE